jgi:hypothetical protein
MSHNTWWRKLARRHQPAIGPLYPKVREWSLNWPEMGLLTLGLCGLGLAQIVAYYGTSEGKASNIFTQSADYRVFAILLGAGYCFCLAITPIAWSMSNKSRSIVGPCFTLKTGVITLIFISIAILALPFLPRVPRLPQIARWQHWRTDFTTLLTLLTVIAPSAIGIVAIRKYAQESKKVVSKQELIDTVSTLRKHLRFYLIILAIAIAIGVAVLATLRSAVGSGLHHSHLGNISNVFPTGVIVLYGAAFSIIFAILYGPAEANLTIYTQRELRRLFPIRWENDVETRESIAIQQEIAGQLELSASQRYERWLAILAPLIAGILAAVGKA